MKFQVKTCCSEKGFHFVLGNVSVGLDRDKIIQEVRQKPAVYDTMFSKIEYKFGSVNADFWLLIHCSINSTDVYTLTKQELIEAVKKHYKYSNETMKHTEKNGSRFHAYISKSGFFIPMLGANKGDKDLLRPFKTRTLRDLMVIQGLIRT